MRPAALLALAGAAGATDALSYLGLGQVFVANMTGNTVLLGIAGAAGHWAQVARSGVALGGFATGVLLGATITAQGRARPGLLIETLVLCGLLGGWEAGIARLVLVALAAIAMGLQSVAVARVDSAGASTTYLTGTLTRLGIRAVDDAAGRETPEPRRLALPALVWPVYLGLAVAGAGLHAAWGPTAAVLPLAGVAVVAWRGSLRRDG